jgi:hypothetical protein
MINVYLSKDDPDSDDIVERLRELVVAHRVVYRDANLAAQGPGDPGLEDHAPEASGPERPTLPVLVDDDTVVRGRKEILAHLEMLELFLLEWSKFQSDACYCDASGNVE